MVVKKCISIFALPKIFQIHTNFNYFLFSARYMISKLANLDVELAELAFWVSNKLSKTFINFLEKV